MSAVAAEAMNRAGLAHGVADWPFGAVPASLPETLPDGRPWPRVLILTLPGPTEATAASLAAQGYPNLVRADSTAALDGTTDYLLVLRAGDLLAPGALPALVMEAVLSGADAVAGLRVLYGPDGVHALDLIATEGRLDLDAGPSTSGEILLSCRAVLGAGGLDAAEEAPIAALWPRLAASGCRLARIGRPVLLHRDSGGAERTPLARSLSIASLTDLGDQGGAGIAQRRLGEALTLCGHRIVPVRLADESPPAAAEWTDAFPRSEAALARHDLVLAGNLHGATRSTALLGRLAQTTPVAAVLHDLFALTGRCTHPKDCPVIATGCDARCPSPDEYPQLAPRRIAEAYRTKQAVLAAPRAPLLLANSDWTAERARDLAPASAVAQITLPFPTGVFRPGDRNVLRAELGLPATDVLVVFGAVIADAPDKGFADLVATLRQVARPGIGFVALGRLDDPSSLGLSNLFAPGPIADEATLARWYGACDIHLTASRLETLGQTPIEAGLCGVPSVAYRATGLTSAILDGVTGLLAEPRPGALAEALEILIADGPLRQRLGAFARIVLESRFSHAASAASLHAALSGAGMPALAEGPRLVFAPDMLGRFAFAEIRHPGTGGTVAAPSRPAVRALRRLKHAVIGRGMPLWLRYVLYAASRLRKVASRGDPR